MARCQLISKPNSTVTPVPMFSCDKFCSICFKQKYLPLTTFGTVFAYFEHAIGASYGASSTTLCYCSHIICFLNFSKYPNFNGKDHCHHCRSGNKLKVWHFRFQYEKGCDGEGGPAQPPWFQICHWWAFGERHAQCTSRLVNCYIQLSYQLLQNASLSTRQAQGVSASISTGRPVIKFFTVIRRAV